jgi:hypothetical protein
MLLERGLMDKQGVGMDMWTSPQNARLDHIPTPPTHAYPQGFRLRPDALRLPNSHLKMKTDIDSKPGQRRSVAHENGDSLN